MKYCAHCGAEVYEEAVICTKCGCAIENIKNPCAEVKSNSWNGLAIAGFVVSFFSALVGMILSIVAYKQVKASGENGKGLAIAGIIIGAIETAIILFYVMIWLGIYFSFLFAFLA